jgi:hypothetical protein
MSKIKSNSIKKRNIYDKIQLENKKCSQDSSY